MEYEINLEALIKMKRVFEASGSSRRERALRSCGERHPRLAGRLRRWLGLRSVAAGLPRSSTTQ